MHMMHLAQVPTHLLELPWAAVPHQRFWGWSSGLLKLSGQLNATTSSNIPQISSNIYPQITHTRDYSIQRHQNSTTMTWSEHNYHVQDIKHTSQTQARAVVPAPVFHRWFRVGSPRTQCPARGEVNRTCWSIWHDSCQVALKGGGGNRKRH